MSDLVSGPDGVRRCGWALSAPEYVDYHDREWGFPLLGDDELFEHLCLEAFQSGLSWLTILRKREAFRRAFSGFQVAEVARFGEADVARLLEDASIVRNRRKILAAIENASRSLDVIAEHGSLAALIWSFRSPPPPAPRSYGETPTQTDDSKALARELKRRGFVHLGPTTLYALMQACGVVNDHLVGCAIRERAATAQAAASVGLGPARR
ncbi:MAG: DNA-3-methyladenine glycosylase I [Gaiellaceae bacterium]